MLSFDTIDGHNWVSGTWYGGEDQSGEGILINVLEGQSAFLAWFTFGSP